MNAEQQREWEDDDLRRAALERAERAEERLRTSRQGGQAMNTTRTWGGLARDEFAALTEPMRRARAMRWAAIVDRLGREHYARYHAPTEARIAEWAARRAAA